MRTLVKSAPFGVSNLFLSQLFDEFLDAENMTKQEVPYNLIKNQNEYELEFNVAGYSKDKFKINIEDNQLSISYEDSKTEDNSEKQYVHKSFSNKSFNKVFTLRDIDINKISAEHRDGILSIVLPKSSANISREVEIK